jgi:hypothetical protein
MKYKLLLVAFFATIMGWGQIITQYIETNSGTTPKGIEIWNNTGSTLNFSTNNLIIQQGSNGAALLNVVTINTGTLVSGGVIVIGTTDIGTYLTGQGLTVPFTSFSFNFNGNDALAVKYGSTTTDVFGTPGSDPGTSWTGGTVSTANQNISILSGITTGATAWTNPSLRFSTISTLPSTLPAGLAGFGIPPSNSTTYTSSWSNTTGPTASLDAIIDGNLTTSADLACKDLTINANRTLTIAPGYKLTVSGNLINNGTIVFKSNASATAMFDVFNGTQSGTGVVTAESYIAARRAFRFVSSPVTTTTTIKQNWQENAGTTAGLGTHITGTGGAANGFDDTATNNPSMFTFTNGTWQAVTTTTTPSVLTAGTPYRLMVRGDRTTDLMTNTPTATATTLRATGTLQTGNLPLNLSSTANDFNFVANPYQAPIYANVMFANGSNYTNVNPLDFYVWDPALGSRGAYSTVSISNGQATGGSSHTNLIYPWEAFFVRTSTNGPASITFKEAYKTQPNIGSARTLAPVNKFLKLNLKGLQTNGTWNYVDGIRFDFASQFSNEVNTEDAQKLSNLDEDLAIQKDNAALFSVERRLLPEIQETVSLFLSKYRTASYVFENQAQNIRGVQAFLKDNYTNTMHELNGTAYPFTVDSAVPASTHANRFDIVFIPSALATPSETAAITLYPNPTKRGEGFYLQGINTAQITVYNVMGQHIPVQVKAQGNALQVTPAQTLSQGIYLVSVTTEGKTQHVKWIVE